MRLFLLRSIHLFFPTVGNHTSSLAPEGNIDVSGIVCTGFVDKKSNIARAEVSSSVKMTGLSSGGTGFFVPQCFVDLLRFEAVFLC